jgi:hypothetical protein
MKTDNTAPLADQGVLKLAGKILHHRDTETLRKKQAKEPVFCGGSSVFPGVVESTEDAEATEKHTRGPRRFWRAVSSPMRAVDRSLNAKVSAFRGMSRR